MIPFAVSVGMWYVFSVVCLALGVHWLATALEDVPSARTAAGFGGQLRLVPVLACVVPSATA